MEFDWLVMHLSYFSLICRILEKPQIIDCSPNNHSLVPVSPKIFGLVVFQYSITL